MSDWQKDFSKLLESFAKELDKFLDHVSEAVETASEEISQAIEDIAEQVETTIGNDLDQYLENLFDPIIEIFTELDNLFSEDDQQEADFSINPKVEASQFHHPACIGCRHYHGRLYEGNLLVCGMHPYGWDDENCPDWESLKQGS